MDYAAQLTTSHSAVTLEFNQLTYAVKNSLATKKFTDFVNFGKSNESSSEKGGGGRRKRILDGVSGSFKPWHLTAIIGPSGSGKTTLMNVLAGYKSNNIVDGTILVNEHPRELSKFRKISSYIMQDDLLLPNLTIREAMNFAALLKLPRKTRKEGRQTVISETLKTIGLLEDCADVRTCNLSGGQRKRLSIALELVNNPPVMFLDEPTSGLDSSTCFSCITLLKSLAADSGSGGRTIVITIHQASARILEQFDALYILSAGGQNIFRGSPQSLVPSLSRVGLECPASHNPADFAIEVANGDFGGESIDLLVKAVNDENPFSNTKVNGHDKLSPSKPYCPSSHNDDDNQTGGQIGHFFHQIWTLYRRSLLCILRDTLLIHVRFGSTILVGILLGILYSNVGDNASKTFHNAGSIQFGIIFLVLCAMMPTVVTFPLERGVFLREHGNCWYSVKTYFLARLFADLPFQLLAPTAYTLITYYMIGQPLETFRLLIAILMSILVSLVAQSIGFVIGAIFSVQSAIFIAPVTVVPMTIFSGFFVTISTVPVYLRWMSWFSYTRWAFQSTLTAVYGFDRQPLQCGEEYCHFKYPKKFLKALECVPVSVTHQTIYLGVTLLILYLVSYLSLLFKIKWEKNH